LFDHHPDLHADIVIAALPEQTEPLSEVFLDAIHPALIIIADSKSPATRRANQALRARLEKCGAPVIYTSEVSSVKISFENNSWNATTIEGQSWSGRPRR
jgi:beta-lactamase superfamily II metal-dependent hydrolase